MPKITIDVGETELSFNVETDDFNQYINEQMPNDKVKPAFNFLSRTVDKDDRKAFEAAVLSNNKPNGLILMQIAAIVAEEFSGDVSITIKKPKKSPAP